MFIAAANEAIKNTSSSGYPEVKDWITYSLALLGIIVTFVFSMMVWKVTKESTRAAIKSAEAAAASHKLNESQLAQQKLLDAATARKYLETIKEKVIYIGNTVFGQSTKLDSITIRNADRRHGLSEIELVKYFSDEQQIIIKEIWKVYMEYLSSYWIVNGEIKMTFNGSEHNEIVQESIKRGNEIFKLIEKL